MATGYFDQVAPEWDVMRKTMFDERIRDQAIAAARLAPGQAAVDVGAGTGFLSEGLLAQGVRVAAVDESEAMVAQMRRKFAGRTGFEAHKGDGLRLPFADGSFDAALANMYLHHVGSPAVAIREMARVLRPGGRLVITDLDQHDHEELRAEHHDRWMGFTRPDVAAWMAEAGLASVAVQGTSECCSTTTAHAGAVAIGVFLARAEVPTDRTVNESAPVVAAASCAPTSCSCSPTPP